MNSARRVGLCAVLVVLAIVENRPLWSQAGLSIGGYQLLSDRRITRDINELTYRATLTNSGGGLSGATARATSLSTTIVMVDPDLTFGPVASGGTVVSTDTFVFRYDRRFPFDWANIGWTITPEAANQAPTANAGPDQTVSLGSLVTLDGSGSTDADGEPLTYSWSLISVPAGSAASLSSPGAVTPTFVIDRAGTYVAQLIVRDLASVSLADTVSITTLANSAPVADAGPDQLDVVIGTTVSLNGAGSSDADGHPLTFAWSLLSRPAGSAATLSSPNAVAPTFVVDGPGTYVAQLVVSDGFVNSAPDTMTVTVGASQPGDSDGDGLTDDAERELGTNPLNPDTDGDTVADGAEVNLFRTDPTKSDTDGDTFRDDGELRAGSSPTDASSIPLPSSGPTSDALIDAAVLEGRLGDEQGLIYKVFAEFSDPRLPSEFRGAPSPNVDSPLMAEVSRRLPELSPAARDILRPFFIQPFYEGSWLSLRLPATQAEVKATAKGKRTRSAATSNMGQITATECVRGRTQYFDLKVTAHANIHYPSQAADAWSNPGAHINAERTAEIVAKYIEEIWAAETTAFGRFPPSDADVDAGCNGGDGALDITIIPNTQWLTAFGTDDEGRGRTVAFNEGCTPRPSQILIRDSYIDNPAAAEKRIRDVLAHEFFHTIEFGYAHPTGCQDYYWLSEATANWAIDLVYPDDSLPDGRAEQGYAGGFMYVEHLAPIDQQLRDDTDKTNGYSDYVFLQYLARKFGNERIKAIWDASELSDSVAALAFALTPAGGLEPIWHQFALDAWNDYEAKVQNAFYTWDKLTWGMKKALDNPRADAGDFRPREVTLDGTRYRQFDLMETAVTFAGGAEIDRLSFHVDSLKFTDDSVSYVVYKRPESKPHVRIQALVKIGGNWRPPEDWTGVRSKSFCRDAVDERIEELVLVYSNGDSARPAAPATFGTAPSLIATNVGCYKWRGSARTIRHHDDGSISIGSGDSVVMERSATFTPTAEAIEFDIASVTVTFEWSGQINATCSFQVGPASNSLTRATFPDLGELSLQISAAGVTAQGYGKGRVTATRTWCVGTLTDTYTVVYFEMPFGGLNSVPLAADGHHLTVSHTVQPGDGNVYTLEINFTADRQ